MAVTVESLYAPLGLLTPSMFPGETTDMQAARVTALVAFATPIVGAAGLSGATADAAVAAYIYAQAFETIAVRMITEASTVTIEDEGTRIYDTNQRELIRGLAAKWRAEYETLVTPLPSAVGRRAVGGAVRTVVGW